MGSFIQINHIFVFAEALKLEMKKFSICGPSIIIRAISMTFPFDLAGGANVF